jgi:hypothetical protein
MSPNEHRLMVFMFARQIILIQSFIEILRSRDILQEGDIEAFEALVRSQEASDHDVRVSVASQYQEIARQLGIEGNLPHA